MTYFAIVLLFITLWCWKTSPTYQAQRAERRHTRQRQAADRRFARQHRCVR